MAVSESATPRRSISIPHMHLNLLSGSNSQSQQRRPSEPQIPSTFSNSNPTINVNPTPSTISTATSSFRSLRNFLPFGPSSSTSSNAQKGTNAHASLGVSSVSSSSLHAPSTSSAKQLPSPFASLRRSFTSERKNSASFVRPRASTSVDEDGPVIAIEAEPSPHYGDRCDELGMRTDTGYEDHARDPREERNREERITRSAPDLFHSSTQDSILRRNGSTNSTNIGNKRDLIAASLHSSPNAGVTANTSLTADLSTILEAENSGMSISISKHIPFLEDEGENERSPLREDDDEDEKDIAERSFLGGLRSSRVNYPSSSPLPSSSRSPLLSSSRSPVHSPIPLAHSPRFSPLSSPQNHHRLLPAPSRSPLSSPSRSPVLSSTPHSRSPLPSPHPHTHSHPHARHLFANLPLPSLHPHLHSHPELTTTPSPDPLDVSTSQLTAQVLDALRPRAQPDLPVERRDGYNVRVIDIDAGTPNGETPPLDPNTHFDVDSKNTPFDADASFNFDALDPDLAALLSPHRVRTPLPPSPLSSHGQNRDHDGEFLSSHLPPPSPSHLSSSSPRMHSPAVNSNPNSTFPHIFPPTTTSLQPAAPIYPATTPSASTSRAHPFGAPSNSSARLLPPPTLTLDRPSQPHSMSTTQPQALSSTLHSPQSSPPRRAFQHALQSSPPRRSFSLAASSNVSRRGDAPTRNGVGGHARAVSLTSHQLPGSSGAAPGPSRLPRLTTTSRPTPSPLSSVSNVGMQSNFNGSGSALNSASSGSGSALNSAVSGSGSRSTGSPNHSSNASPVQPNTSPLQFNNGNTPALIVNKRRRAHLFLHRKRSMSVEEVAVPKIHGEDMPRPSLGDVGQSRPSFGDVRRHRYGDGDESRPSSSASNRPPPAGLGSASGLRRPRMITERVASSSAMDRLGPSNSDRPPAMEWLGPRTVKAFAAAGLLDESDPRTRDNGGHFDRDRELAKERERQQHRDHDAPSRTTFSEAGSSVSASWGARMRNPHPPSHPRSMTPSSSVYPRSMTPSTSAHTRCMTPSTRTGTMSPSNTNVSPTFSFSAARTHSGSSAPTSVSYGSGYAAGNPPTREIRAQHPNTAPPSQASSHSHSTHSSSHTAAETAGQSRNRTLVSNQIEAQVSLLKEKHEVETGALLGALSDSQRTTKALREENFTLRGENYALKEEIGVLKGDNGMLRDEGKALKARVGALVEELEGMRRELEDLGGEVERLRLGEGARVRVEGWDRSQQKNNMAQSTSRYRSSSLSSRIQGSPSLRRPYLPRSRSQLHQMTLGDDNAGAWGGSKEEDVDVDDSRNHHFDGHKFDGDRRKRGQDSHQSNWEESANTWDNRRISWDEDRQGWGADDQDHNTENQSIQYTRRRASTTSSISIFPNLPTNMSMLMHEPASPMFGLRTGSNGDVKRNHEKQAQWSRSNSSGSGNESRSGSPAMDNTVGEFGRQLTPGCVHSSSKTTSAHVSTPASNSIYSSTTYDSTPTYTSMSANIPISSPDNSRSPANISPTTANFSMTEMTGSPGSLQLRPEHELHLGDMASLSLYAMSDGEEGDFEL